MLNAVERKLEQGTRSKNAVVRHWSESLHLALRTFYRPIVEIQGVRLKLSSTFSEHVKKAVVGEKYEQSEWSIVEKTLETSDRVLELGAGIGFLSIYCAQRVGQENVCAVEANPDLIHTIQHNYDLNRVAPRLIQALAAHANGSADFYIAKDFWSSSSAHEPKVTIKRVPVPSISINPLICEFCPTYLIMDIEGGEYALLGQMDFGSIRKICCEFHPAILGSEKIDELFRILNHHGFTEQPELKALDSRFFLKSSSKEA